MDCALAGAKGSSAKQPSNDSSFKWPRVKSTPVPEMLAVNRGRAGRLERHQHVEAGILHIPDEALSRHATIECDIARRAHRSELPNNVRGRSQFYGIWRRAGQSTE